MWSDLQQLMRVLQPKHQIPVTHSLAIPSCHDCHGIEANFNGVHMQTKTGFENTYS